MLGVTVVQGSLNIKVSPECDVYLAVVSRLGECTDRRKPGVPLLGGVTVSD
jgi:hypothetical protein